MRKLGVVPSSRPNDEINITPLVDVVLVLLIIFMVATPLTAAQLHVDTPEEDSESAPPDDRGPVSVELGPDGRVRLEAMTVTPAELEPRLARLLAKRSTTQRTVQVTAADEAAYEDLIRVLDSVKSAGAQRIAFAP